jgi:thiol-disulfide isomerase/thioredoxin
MKQTAFEPHEMIRIFWWTSGEETRGITLWLEPQGRQAQPGAEEITTEQKNAPVRGDDAPGIDHSEAAEKKLWAKSILNQKAPELTVEKWLSGKPSTEGKFVLIDFRATWCGPCIKAIPELNEFQKKYEDNLVVIGISDESPDTVAKFSSPQIEYFSAIDTKATTKKILGVSGIPHVIILDPEGIVRWEGFPFLDGHELSSAVLDKIFTKYGGN